MSVTDAVFKITASVVGASAIKDLEKSIKGASSSGDIMARSLAKGALALRTFATSIAVSQFKEFIGNQIDIADNLNDISQKTGVAVETLGKYAIAAKNSGTDIEALASGLGKLNKNIVEARDGTGPAAAAFSAMSISVKDAKGNLKSADEITGEIANRFSDFPDGPQKAALAMAVFGKAGAELIPFLNNGKQGIEDFSSAFDSAFGKAADSFNDKLGVMNANIGKFAGQTAKELLPALNDALDEFTNLFGSGSSATEFGKIISDAMRGVVVALGFVVQQVKNTIAVIQGLGKAAYGVFQMSQGDLKGGYQTAAGAASGTFDAFSKNEADFDALLKRQREGSYAFGDGQSHSPMEITVSKYKNTASQSAKMSAFNPTAAAAAAAATKDATKAIQEYIRAQKEENITLQEEGKYFGLTTIEVEKLKEARKIDQDFAKKTKDLSPSQVAAYRAETEAIKEQRLAIMQSNYEKSRTFETGAKSFLTRYAEDASNSAEQVKTVFQNAFKGAEDALVDFATTGKLNFKEFANSIIKDLIRITIQRGILGPIASALGGIFGGSGGLGFSTVTAHANGGVMTSDGPVPLRKYATGGIATSPQMALFGEGSRPEAYVPLPDGRRIPVALSGNGGGGTNVSVTVNVESGQQTSRSEDKQGAALGNLIASVVKQTLINEKRQGGMLA